MAKRMGLALLLAIGVAAAALPGIAAEATRQPNIILILVDDAGYADFPYFQDEAPRTPNIDSLCDEGLRFTQFYSNAPICSPSRAAWVTGQYPARSGITSFIAARRENSRRGIRDWLDPVAPSLARILHEAGYATAHFGKWHLGGGRDVGDAPLITEYGFDESLTQFEGLGDRVLPLLNHDNGSGPKKYPLGVDSAQLGRGEVEWVDRSKITARFVDRATKFIKESEKSGQPFYINLWPDDVHTPLVPPLALRGDGGKRELYLGVLENMDQALGRLFDFIRANDSLSDNTLIIVTSDNGHEPGAGSAGDLKGSKGTLYEGGIREPFIAWGPSIIPRAAAGTTNATTVLSSIDVVASFIKLAGAEVPAGVELDGEDLTASLIGARQQTRDTPLYWNRPPDRGEIHGQNLPDLAIREGKWKLLVDEDGSHPQLYDIETDPYENANLARRRPQVARRLQSQVIDRHRVIVGAKTKSYQYNQQ